MKTLHLNLKRKWFEMILSGEKTEEYRLIKKHWIRQLIKNKFSSENYVFEQDIIDLIVENKEHYCKNRIKEFSTITFSNGYNKDSPQFEIEFKGIEIKEGNPNWGAEKGVKYFSLKLGEILNDVNCAKFILKSHKD